MNRKASLLLVSLLSGKGKEEAINKEIKEQEEGKTRNVTKEVPDESFFNDSVVKPRRIERTKSFYLRFE